MLDLQHRLQEPAVCHHQCQQARSGHQLQTDLMERLLHLTISLLAVWVLRRLHIHRELCRRAPRSSLHRSKRCSMDLQHIRAISHRASKDHGVDNRLVKDQTTVVLVLLLLGQQALVRICIINSHSREATVVPHRKVIKTDHRRKVGTLIVPCLPTHINSKLAHAQTQTIAPPTALFEVKVLL